MKNKDIRKLWEEFVNDEKYKKYFMTNEEEWKINLKNAEIYIDKYNKRPPTTNNEYSKLGKWISHQLENYKKGTRIMKNKDIQKLWEEFTEKYSKYFN